CYISDQAPGTTSVLRSSRILASVIRHPGDLESICRPQPSARPLPLRAPALISSTIRSIREAVREHHRLGAAVAGSGEQLERAAAVGLGAMATAAGLGHGAVAAVLGQCP